MVGLTDYAYLAYPLNKGEGPKALSFLLKFLLLPLDPANTSHRKLSQLYFLRFLRDLNFYHRL